MSRVTNDVNMIQFFFNMAGTVILSSIVLTAMNLAFMLALDWVMALAILSLFPFFIAMQSVAQSGSFRCSGGQISRWAW